MINNIEVDEYGLGLCWSYENLDVNKYISNVPVTFNKRSINVQHYLDKDYGISDTLENLLKNYLAKYKGYSIYNVDSGEFFSIKNINIEYNSLNNDRKSVNVKLNNLDPENILLINTTELSKFIPHLYSVEHLLNVSTVHLLGNLDPQLNSKKNEILSHNKTLQVFSEGIINLQCNRLPDRIGELYELKEVLSPIVDSNLLPKLIVKVKRFEPSLDIHYTPTYGDRFIHNIELEVIEGNIRHFLFDESSKNEKDGKILKLNNIQ